MTQVSDRARHINSTKYFVPDSYLCLAPDASKGEVSRVASVHWPQVRLGGLPVTSKVHVPDVPPDVGTPGLWLGLWRKQQLGSTVDRVVGRPAALGLVRVRSRGEAMSKLTDI